MSTIVLPQGIQIPEGMGRAYLCSAKTAGTNSETVPYLYVADGPCNDLCDFYYRHTPTGELIPFYDAWNRADYVAKICNWVYDYSRLPWWAFIRRRRMLRQLPKQKV